MSYVRTHDDQPVTGVKTFYDFPVGPIGDPTSDRQFVTKKYVDDHASSAPSGTVISNLVGSGKTLTGVNGTAGDRTVTLSSGHPFLAGDVGKFVLLDRADTASARTLVAIIAAVNADNSIELDRDIITTVTNTTMYYGVDETSVFQDDINRAAAYALLHGGKVKLKVAATEGHIVIGGPLSHDGQGNSQIVLPVWPTTGPKLVLEIDGSNDGSATQHWQTETPNLGGTTFVSYFNYASAAAQLSDINAYGHSSVIGGPTEPSGLAGQGGAFNNVQCVLRDLQIRTPHTRDGIGIGAAFLASCASGGVERFGWGTLATVAQGVDSVGYYETGLVIGLYLPTAGNNDLSYMSNATCHGGYKYAVWVSEHTDMFSVRLLYGWAGLCIVGNYWSSGGTTHGVNGFLSIEACAYFLYFIGVGSGGNGPYLHLTIDTEGTLKIGDNASGVPSLGATGKLWLMGEIDQDTFTTDYPIGFDIELLNTWYPNKGITANWTVDTFTELIVVDATAGNVTLSLPISDGRGKPISVVLGATASGHTCTIDPNGSETISGATTKVLSTQWDHIRIEPYAHNWVQTG